MTDDDPTPPDVSRSSLWLLRVAAVLVAAILLYFLIDAIVG